MVKFENWGTYGDIQKIKDAMDTIEKERTTIRRIELTVKRAEVLNEENEWSLAMALGYLDAAEEMMRKSGNCFRRILEDLEEQEVDGENDGQD